MILSLLAAVTLAQPSTGFSIQVGEASMVPSESLPLGGYTARGDAKFEAGGDKLRARTLILGQGKKRVALVAVETLTMPESLVAAVRSQFPANLPIWLVATHTHCAPDSSLFNSRMKFKVPGIASYSSRWTEWAASQISASIKKAEAAPRIVVGSLATIVGDRRLNRGRRPEAVPDPLVTRVMDADSVRPWLVVYAAHPTNYSEKELKLRGDWPGKIMDRAPGLGLPGAIGDASPVAPGKTPAEQCDRMAQSLIASSPDDRLVDLARSGLNASSAPIALDKPAPHPNFAKDNKVPAPLAIAAVNAFAPPSAEVQALQFGRTLIIGVPGEPTADLGREIQNLPEAKKFSHVVVLSHVNGWIGYILEPEDYDRGGYEATLSFNGRLTSKRVVDACQLAIQRLKTP